MVSATTLHIQYERTVPVIHSIQIGCMHRYYELIREAVGGEEELNCYHLQLSHGHCYKIYWGKQDNTRERNYNYETIYTDILSEANLSGIPETVIGDVIIVYGRSNDYSRKDFQVLPIMIAESIEDCLDIIRESFMMIETRGCMRTIIPHEEESLGEDIFSRNIYRPLPFDYSSWIVRALTEVLQYDLEHGDLEHGDLEHDEMDMPIGMRRSSVIKTTDTGPSLHLAKLAVKASIADKGTCAVSLCVIGEEEVALVPPCGHVCGPMARSLTECPTCRTPAMWTEVRIADL